jgi:hypothetical protein
MKISISQPAYLPWLGYFDRVANSDLAVVLDSVMLERSSKTRFTNRNKIRTEEGWMWLTVPVKTSGLGQPLIRDVMLDNEQKWQQKHWKSLQHNYSKAEFFNAHFKWFDDFYNTKWDCLLDLLEYSTNYLLNVLDIQTKFVSASKIPANGHKADLILNICKELGATTYLSGPFGRDYLNIHDFEAAGIEVIFQEYTHPQYSQAYPGFEPYMSVIDLIFNHGNRSAHILKT